MLFTKGDLVYYSTSDGIAYKSVTSPTEATVLVEGMTIITNKIGYDYFESGNLKNLYFYAQRVYEESEDDTTDSDTTEAEDTNYYLYTVSARAATTPQILGKTVV